MATVETAKDPSLVPQHLKVDGSGNLLVAGSLTVAAGTEVKVTDGTDDLEITAAGAAKVDGSGVVQPVSGTVTANAGTGPFPVSDNSGSLTVDNNGTFATQAAQSGTWQYVPNRPSQGANRTYKFGALSNQTTDQTVYTVTSGKVLYVTSIVLSGFNTSTATSGLLHIEDNGTLRLAISSPVAGVGALASSIPVSGNIFTFLEPMQFSTAFEVDVVQGTLTYSVSFVGYEE